jgi:hypothetical protein
MGHLSLGFRGSRILRPPSGERGRPGRLWEAEEVPDQRHAAQGGRFLASVVGGNSPGKHQLVETIPQWIEMISLWKFLIGFTTL